MTTDPTRHVVAGAGRRRARMGALALIAAATVAGTGVAAAATRHAPAAGHRVLNIVQSSTETPYATDALQYVTPDDRYQLVRESDHGRPHGYFWQRDVLGGSRRSVKRVQIDPGRKMVLVDTRTAPPLPPAPLGIRSTAAAVRHAIADGRAHARGIGVRDGQRVRVVILPLGGSKARSNELWIEPATDRPVAARRTVTVGGGGVQTTTSHWETLGASAFAEVTQEPKFPAGYTVVSH